MKLFTKILPIIVSVFLLTGCSAIDKSIKHGALDVQTKMSKTIFLEPIAGAEKTALLQVKNTSDRKNLDILPELRAAIENKGYKIVDDPENANFMIQANILQVGKSTQEDAFRGLTFGYGGALAGSAAGAMISDNYRGVGIGGLSGSLIDTVADAAVQVVSYQMITDLQISERADGVVSESNSTEFEQGSGGKTSSSWSQTSKWKKYQTRIISVAKKTNLKFDKALPELKRGLVQSISGLL